MLHASLDPGPALQEMHRDCPAAPAVLGTLESLCSGARRGRKLQRLGRDLICYEACSISQASGESVFRVDISSEFAEAC